MSLEVSWNSNEHPSASLTEEKDLSELLDPRTTYDSPNLKNYEASLNIEPIEAVKALRVRKPLKLRERPPRCQNLKPVWLKADIYKRHLNTGEDTDQNKSLAKVIQERGMHGPVLPIHRDDCGHAVANKLGGKMVDFNLFPQNSRLNRGWKNTHLLWRSLEKAMQIWLEKIPKECNPHVIFQILFTYSDVRLPDRPDRFKWHVQFISSSYESEDSTLEGKRFELSAFVPNMVVEILRHPDLMKGISETKAWAETCYSKECQDVLQELTEMLRELWIPLIEPPYSGGGGQPGIVWIRGK